LIHGLVNALGGYGYFRDELHAIQFRREDPQAAEPGKT
jgi:hypothetical protein